MRKLLKNNKKISSHVQRLLKKHCSATGSLTVGEVNARLDALVAADAAEDKVQVLL